MFASSSKDAEARQTPSKENSTPVRSASAKYFSAKPTAKRQPVAMEGWIPRCDQYLDRLMASEAPDPSQLSTCQAILHDEMGVPRVCGNPQPRIRCRDCIDCCTVQCDDCSLRRHENLPFHRLERWNEKYFEDSSLDSLGYTLRMCPLGERCGNPVPAHRNFVAFHTNGYHRLRVMFCGCGTALKYEQLLSFRLFPATSTEPQTVFSFEFLNLFHLLTLQGKLTLHDYYQAIIRCTDNMNNAPGVWRYHDAILATRQWRHLKMLKRAGRGNDPTGVSGTPDGGLAVECPACPHPGRNLPDRWETDPNIWMYTLFIAIDACFKLKLRNRGFTAPPLGDGLSYFVKEEKYREHLDSCSDEAPEDDVEPCDSHHNAVSQMNTKNSGRTLLVTGLGGAVCARHSLVRKNGVADLTRGERQVTMDYIFWTTIFGCALSFIIASYDIACSWSIHLMDRLQRNYDPSWVAEFAKMVFVFLLPKLHIHTHGPKCRRLYDFQHTPHVGRTHAETIEQLWAHLGGVATSIVEMAPAARRVTLEDHMGNWNHMMKMNMGINMYRSLTEALDQRSKHRQLFDELDATFDRPTVERWTKLVKAFERDKKQGKDPYAEPELLQTFDQVRKKLEQEEKASLNALEPDHDISPAKYVQQALKLLDRRRALKQETDIQRSEHHRVLPDLQRKCEALQRDVRNLADVAPVYMPCIVMMPGENAVQDAPSSRGLGFIHLPSSLGSDQLRSTGCIRDLVKTELQMRIAEAADTLEAICKMRRSLMGLIHKYRVQVSGSTSAKTRSHAILQNIGRKIQLLVIKYRDARLALLTLSPDGDWKNFLHELENDDVRGPYPEEDESEGRREDSWIWRSRGRLVRTALNLEASSDGPRVESDKELDDTMLYMWAGSRARAFRWHEEVQLLVEEMRRVIAFLNWQARTWESTIGSRTRSTDGVTSVCAADISRGADCYAYRQASLCRALAEAFVRRWKPLLNRAGLGQTWLSQYHASASTTVPVPGRPPASQGKKLSDAAGDELDADDSVDDEGEEGAEGEIEEDLEEEPGGKVEHDTPLNHSTAFITSLLSEEWTHATSSLWSTIPH
ncbi:hypothetical protein PUNSTDRAFT_133777 [Punctularia strigosozonata HHB-11173 SS5]|uniref:uncharacterized protein n=1 Tax=Punctularia strigosozonata (strain HHB-11173) TaxID=741275 RepID=UPI0004416780|nr:uncharacterized protein PUNSTDRAFT_133777 [Punctularia strigosozonata HHB-11173 SS5]EIN10007.1 hypothetical protein PUNSTDRAFT_133777 [Punctularia strigosozonata HHB-11173 SS5]